MASIAHVQHPSQRQLVRAEHAAQGFQHTVELLEGMARRTAAVIVFTFRRLAAAQQRAAENRLLRELAFTDRRVWDEIRAIRDRAESDAGS